MLGLGAEDWLPYNDIMLVFQSEFSAFAGVAAETTPAGVTGVDAGVVIENKSCAAELGAGLAAFWAGTDAGTGSLKPKKSS
jgi:hypothetical protein